MPILSDGTMDTRSITAILKAWQDAVHSNFGSDFNLTPGSVVEKLGEAAMVMPLAETEQTIKDVYDQVFFDSASGGNLDKIVAPIGFTRIPASRATGTVNVTLKAAKSDTDFNPMFAVGDLTFVDTAGRFYDMTEDAVLGSASTSSLSVKVRARVASKDGNIAASGINQVQFGNTTASSRWTANVNTYTNSAAFSTGADSETDSAFRSRIINARSAVMGCSLDGLISAVGTVTGVTGVTGKENTDVVTTADDTVFSSTQTGTSSETINSTNTKIAQKMVTTDRRFVQFIKAKLTSDTSLVGTWRIETDSSGSPSGTLVNSNFSLANASFGGTTLVTFTFANGAYLPAGTYWLVFQRTSGSGVFDGGTGGSADQVKFNNGSWTLSASVENLNAQLIGGIPPKAFRIWVSGSPTASDIAKTIWDNKAAGISSDGLQSGTAKDRSGTTQTLYYETPSEVRVYVTVTVVKNATFTGTANSIKDIIVDYIGGTDNAGANHDGLGVAKTLYRNEVISRLLDDSIIQGTVDVTVLNIDTVSPPTGTSNLVPSVNQKYKITNLADIVVTLTDE